MIFDRREFLKKLSISMGIATLPGIGYASVFQHDDHQLEYILHLSGRSNVGADFIRGKSARNRMVFSTVSPLAFSNQENIKSKEVGVQAILYGGEWLSEFGGFSIDHSFVNQLPFVNSNFTSLQKAETVSKFLIFSRAERKIGVMGIGFGEKGQTIPDTIQTMNRVALHLKKDLDCDEVYCLADNPAPYFQYFSLGDLALASLNINQFFGSDVLSDRSQLLVLQNRDKGEVLLTITSPREGNQSLISMQEGRFSNFNLIRQRV